MTVFAYHRKILFAAALLGAGVVAPAHAEEPMAVPYRPTVSTQANLPTPGWLEVEMGIGRTSGGDDKRRDNFNYLLKYAFDEDWAVMAGGEGHVRRRSLDDESFSGLGDTSFTLKRRFAYSEHTLFGLEAGFKSPTANNAIGSGKTDYTLNGILSSDMGPIHLDANLRATRLGLREEGKGRYETTWAAAFSINQESGSYVAAEFSGVNRRNTAAKTQLMAAVGYAPNKRTVWDFGVASGLSKAAPDWGAFAGVTYLWEKISK